MLQSLETLSQKLHCDWALGETSISTKHGGHRPKTSHREPRVEPHLSTHTNPQRRVQALHVPHTVLPFSSSGFQVWQINSEIKLFQSRKVDCKFWPRKVIFCRFLPSSWKRQLSAASKLSACRTRIFKKITVVWFKKLFSWGKTSYSWTKWKQVYKLIYLVIFWCHI